MLSVSDDCTQEFFGKSYFNYTHMCDTKEWFPICLRHPFGPQHTWPIVAVENRDGAVCVVMICCYTSMVELVCNKGNAMCLVNGWQVYVSPRSSVQFCTFLGVGWRNPIAHALMMFLLGWKVKPTGQSSHQTWSIKEPVEFPSCLVITMIHQRNHLIEKSFEGFGWCYSHMDTHLYRHKYICRILISFLSRYTHAYIYSIYTHAEWCVCITPTHVYGLGLVCAPHFGQTSTVSQCSSQTSPWTNVAPNQECAKLHVWFWPSSASLQIFFVYTQKSQTCGC